MFRKLLLAFFTLSAGLAHGQVVSYEGNSFPEIEDPSWEREFFCTPIRSIDNGWFVQDVDTGCGGPPRGDQDGYRQDLDQFIGANFFVEFRLQVTGDRSEIIGQAPFALAAASSGPVRYGWTIARDQVKLVRDVLLPILFIDVVPDVPHTYRLTLEGSLLYTWFIDGQVVDTGTPEDTYPGFKPFIVWLGSVLNLSSINRLDYLRFGVIPTPATGDWDSDGIVDENDLPFFVECLQNSGDGVDAGPGCPWADMDSDTDVDCADWEAFKLGWDDPTPPDPLPECPGIPTTSTWGATIMALLLLRSCDEISVAT